MAAAVAPDKHDRNPQSVTIEHAQIILGRSGMPDQLYLTIHNETQGDVRIASVTAGGYLDARVVVPGRANAAGGQTVDEAFLVIPKLAEIDMRPGTLFIQLERRGNLPRRVQVTVAFGDGSQGYVPATILPPEGTPSDHHHEPQK